MIARLVVTLLVGSIVSLLWMWIGGLVTYVPGTVTSDEMQNKYLSRIFWFGLLSGVLQFAAIVLTLRERWRSGKDSDM